MSSRALCQENAPWSILSTCVLLVVAVLIVFGRTVLHEFVDYDDGVYFFNNPHVLSGLNWDNVIWAFRTTHACNWHPITWLSLMLDAELFGHGPFGPHLSNVVLHAANSVLLFLFLRLATGAHWNSAFVAGLFALHPLHVESVAWVSERKDVLSAFFGFLTLLFYCRYAQIKCRNTITQAQPAHHQQIRLNYGLALFFFALGLMSKPMLVTLPFVMLLLDTWPLRRFATPGNPPASPQTVPQHPSAAERRSSVVLRLLQEKLPFFALSMLSSAMTLVAQKQALRTIEQIPIDLRVINALVAYIRYLGKTFWPVNLAIPYPYPGYWPMWVVCCSVAMLLALSVLVLYLRHRFPFLVVGWLWFVGMLIPVIGLVQVGPQSMADRYTYLPLVGVFIMLTWSVHYLINRWKLPRQAIATAAAIILIACALRTFDQVKHWQNSETLFAHAAAVTKHNYIANYNLGHYYFRKNNIDKATDYYLAALQIRPEYDDALINLGVALALRGDLEGAVARLQQAIAVSPHKADAHYNLGNVLVMQHRLEEAAAAYKQALVLNPDYPEAHNNLANVLAMQGDKNEAAKHYIEALRLNPHFEAAKRGLQMLGEIKEPSNP